jgi:hypothetical protein
VTHDPSRPFPPPESPRFFLPNIEDAMSDAEKPSLKANVDVAPDDNIDFHQEELN